MADRTHRQPSILSDMDTPETATYYDKLMDKFIFFRPLSKKVMDLGIERGSLLDVACGPGHLLAETGKLAGELKLYGVDLSTNMLDVARNNLSKRLPGRSVTLAIGSMYELPFGNETFDLVISTNVIHFAEQPVDYFNELWRVLKPGGAGFVSGFKRDTPVIIYTVARLQSRYLAWRGYPLDGGARVIESSYTKKEIDEFLKSSNVNDYDIDAGLMQLYVTFVKKAAGVGGL